MNGPNPYPDTLSRERLEHLKRGYTRQAGVTKAGDGFAYIMGNAEDILPMLDMAMRTEQAERERDALRAQLEAAVEWGEGGFDFCFSCTPDDETKGHEDFCWVGHAKAALAEPDAGGDA